MGTIPNGEKSVESGGSQIYLVTTKITVDQPDIFVHACLSDGITQWCEHKQTLLTRHPDRDWFLLESLLTRFNSAEGKPLDEPIFIGIPYVPTYLLYVTARIDRLQESVWKVSTQDWHGEIKSIGLISVGEGFGAMRLMLANYWFTELSTPGSPANVKCVSSSHSYQNEKKVLAAIEKHGKPWEVANQVCLIQNGRCIMCNYDQNTTVNDPDLVPEA